MRLRIVLAAVAVALATPARASEPGQPTGSPPTIEQKVLEILRNEYPGAVLETDRVRPEIHTFSANTRTFTIYRQDKVGDWQEREQVEAPDRGGIAVRFYVRERKWDGALFVPHTGTRCRAPAILIRVPPAVPRHLPGLARNSVMLPRLGSHRGSCREALMLTSPSRVATLLPKNWPRRVRSAVVHAISMSNVVFAVTRSHAENHFSARVRLQAENDRLRREVALLCEELRIKDTRMLRIQPQRRPHYPPVERLAILELRAARAWSLAETARRLLVNPLTVASWNRRLDDEGPDALVRLKEPVNRFPDFVRYLVRRLKTLCPSMGSRRIARVLARAGLHLGATTVRRMLRRARMPESGSTRQEVLRVVTAKRPNHVWHADLTTVPTSLGFWLPWLPHALPQRWPFCWWLAVVVDHYSRRVIGFTVFKSEPAASDLTRFLGRLHRVVVGSLPSHLITDHGPQFTADSFRRWCRRRGVRQRFGAVGRYGSIAVVERFIRSMKGECTRTILVSWRLVTLERELGHYVAWFNGHRPHEWLGGRTPDEVYFGGMPAVRKPRFEPRARWPRRSPCARPQALVRGRTGVVVDLRVGHRAGRKHLPIVSLQRVV